MTATQEREQMANQPHRSRQQVWAPGALVRVGFLTLRVVNLIPTPGDHRPDVYVLVDPRDSSRIYHFTPHHGLKRQY